MLAKFYKKKKTIYNNNKEEILTINKFNSATNMIDYKNKQFKNYKNGDNLNIKEVDIPVTKKNKNNEALKSYVKHNSDISTSVSNNKTVQSNTKAEFSPKNLAKANNNLDNILKPPKFKHSILANKREEIQKILLNNSNISNIKEDFQDISINSMESHNINIPIKINKADNSCSLKNNDKISFGLTNNYTNTSLIKSINNSNKEQNNFINSKNYEQKNTKDNNYLDIFTYQEHNLNQNSNTVKNTVLSMSKSSSSNITPSFNMTDNDYLSERKIEIVNTKYL